MSKVLSAVERTPVRALDTPHIAIPPAYWRRICDFLVDKGDGNVHIHVKDGKVLGLRIEEIVRL